MLDPDKEKEELQESIEKQSPAPDPEILSLKETLAGIQQQLGSLATTVATRPAPVPAVEEPKFREVSDSELREAWEDQDFDRYNALQRERERKREYEYQKQIQQVQSVGIEKIGGLTRHIAKQSMPHYDRYKDEIEGVLQSVDPSHLMNPETYEMAYKMVVANHMDDLVKEEVKRQLELANHPDPPLNTNIRGNQSSRGYVTSEGEIVNGAPQPSSEALAALQSKGWTPDQFAQRMGYENWAEYAKEEEAA